jgi:hypothetical protein
MSNTKLMKICEGMSAMAATHANDEISNALARVSRKIESMGTTKFAPTLSEVDLQVVRFYMASQK